MKYQYVKGRIEEGIDRLCTGVGDAKKRMLSANDATSSLLDIHFPTEWLSDWKSIQERMTRYGLEQILKEKWFGAVEKISNKTANEIAKNILILHKKLQSE